MQKIISPSLLSANFLNLEQEVAMLNESEAQWFHLDVMDGIFVPNITFGMPVVSAIRSATDKVLDVHLMIQNASRYIEDFAAIGADVITVHAEAVVHLNRTIAQIKSLGKMAGVALCPSTSLSAIEEILPELDVVMLMSVNPGFSGQKFVTGTMDKLRRLRQMIVERGLSTIIQIDGGVNPDNAAVLFDAGAECLVAGNAVFKTENPKESILRILGR
ncbi:MAG: ribulose-phosphate 3-epimerase [Rikenellaceae bacterium]